jgi:hypothetical protein
MNYVKDLYENTHFTMQEIAMETGVSPWSVWNYIQSNYSKAYIKERKVICYSNSKLGDKNPQFGLRGEQTAGYVGVVGDGNGYLMVLKPDWYTGRKGSKHVFQHQVVICEALGLTEIPKGWCVHHIDGLRTNNNLNNLAFLTTSAHSKLHSLERATTRAKARRVQVDSKRNGEVAYGASRDIV